jgi:hypothetical protein
VKAEAKKIIFAKARITKKAENKTKKTTKKAKPSKIIVLRLGSTVLNSLGLYEAVEIDIKNTQEEIIEYVTRRGKRYSFYNDSKIRELG